MEKIFLLLCSLIFIFSNCQQTKRQEEITMRTDIVYANDQEKIIIYNMNCWRNAAFLLANDADAAKVTKGGRESLLYDSLFITIVRNDSLYESLLQQRKNLAKQLRPFKKKVPFFAEHLDDIEYYVIEYMWSYNGKEWGILKYPFKKETYSFGEIYYNNYSELLKEGYSLLENQTLTEEDVVALNKLLKSIEELDRKLWTVKYFKEKKSELEKHDLEEERARQIDELFNQ